SAGPPPPGLPPAGRAREPAGGGCGMIVQMRYAGPSAIVNGLSQAHVRFAANTLRGPTSFRGTLARPLLLLQALAAPNPLVVSDYKTARGDGRASRAWREEQARRFLAGLAVRGKKAGARMEELEARLAELDRARRERLRPFYAARQDYFNHVYTSRYELQ